MKFSFLLTLALASVVLAIKRDTNADRMRRGLTPMRPRTGTPTLASRGSPSAVPTYWYCTTTFVCLILIGKCSSSIYTTAVPIEILDMSNNVKGYMGQKTQDGYVRPSLSLPFSSHPPFHTLPTNLTSNFVEPLLRLLLPHILHLRLLPAERQPLQSRAPQPIRQHHHRQREEPPRRARRHVVVRDREPVLRRRLGAGFDELHRE